jgi:RNA polymerase sigma-70 factor (ECF subfamily)
LGDASKDEEPAAAATAESGPPFELVVREFAPLVARIAASYEADHGLREDLVQQIWIAIWQSLGSWRGDAPLKGFIAKIAQNRAITHVSRQSRQPRSAQLYDNLKLELPGPEERAIASIERERLIIATRRLPLPQRQVIVLLLEGFAYADIAAMLDIAPNALSLRLARAKAALGKMLGGVS